MSKKLRKGALALEIENTEYDLAAFDYFKSELLAELGRVNNKDLGDMLYRMGLTYELWINWTITNIVGSLGIYQKSDLNLMLNTLIPNEVKVNNKIDDIIQRLNLTTTKTKKFTKKPFFYTILCSTPSHSGPFADITGFVQKLRGTYQTEKPINTTGNDKVLLNCGCNNGIVVNGDTEHILYSFALDKPPGHKIYKETRIKLFEMIKKIYLVSYNNIYIQTR